MLPVGAPTGPMTVTSADVVWPSFGTEGTKLAEIVVSSSVIATATSLVSMPSTRNGAVAYAGSVLESALCTIPSWGVGSTTVSSTTLTVTGWGVSQLRL